MLLAARQRLRGGATAQAVVADQPGATPEPAAAGESVLLRKLSTKELLIAGATSGRVGAAAAIAGILLQFGEELMPRSVWERLPWEDLADAAQSVQVIASVFVTLGVLAWLISIVATALTYGGFELRREGDQLQVQYGLLDRRRVAIPIRRIQAIRVVETMFRQPFGFAEVRFDLAGLGAEEGSRGVLSPLMPRREVAALLEAACPQFAVGLTGDPVNPLPRRALRRYVVAASVGWVIFVLAAMAIAWRVPNVPAWWALPGLAVTPLFGALGRLRYRDAGWLLDGSRFLLRWRSVSRVTLLTEVRRLQYRGLEADPFQRRAGLVTFQTAVASGGVRQGFSLPHLDAQAAETLVRDLDGRSRR
jgi:putative membrane protein